MTSEFVFYIYAPQYTTLSSGIRVLYILCDYLNKIGYESYVTSIYKGAEFIAPTLTSEIIRGHSIKGKKQVAIYPEIMMDNPLHSKYVIRWLLNKPNNFLQNWLGDFSDYEFIVHHDDSFKPKWINSNKQYTPHIDRSIFNTKASAHTRRGVIIYEHRNRFDPAYVKKFKNIQYISSKKPLSPIECANLYKKSEALIIGERSAAFGEAALCGCPTVFLNNENFDSSYIQNTYWTLSSFNKFTSNINELNYGNGIKLEKLYDEEVKQEFNNFEMLIKKAIIIFNDFGDLAPENSPSILLQNCYNLVKLNKYEDALILLERLFSMPEIPNKAYYLYYKICLILNNREEMEFAEKYLYHKIIGYGGNAYFEKIFDFKNMKFFDKNNLEP